jgi:hypothetical protein
MGLLCDNACVCRFDSRRNLIDWDYSMKLKDLGAVVLQNEFEHWRMTGLAYELRDAVFSFPNATLVSHRDGKPLPGFHGDIVNSPYHTFAPLAQSLLGMTDAQIKGESGKPGPGASELALDVVSSFLQASDELASASEFPARRCCATNHDRCAVSVQSTFTCTCLARISSGAYTTNPAFTRCLTLLSWATRPCIFLRPTWHGRSGRTRSLWRRRQSAHSLLAWRACLLTHTTRRRFMLDLRPEQKSDFCARVTGLAGSAGAAPVSDGVASEASLGGSHLVFRMRGVDG